MKALIILSSLVLGSVWAQTDIDSRIEMRAQRLNDLILRDQSHRYLSSAQKEEVLRNLNGVIQSLRGETPGDGYMEVTAIVENYLLVMRGNNGDIFQQCTSRLPNQQADEITIVTNNAPVKRLTNSGWWQTSSDACAVIMQNLRPFDGPTRLSFNVYGYFENRPYNINASSKAQALEQCARAYGSMGQSDEVTVAVGNNPMRRVTTSGWWSNSSAVCNEVMKVVDSYL